MQETLKTEESAEEESFTVLTKKNNDINSYSHRFFFSKDYT